MDLIVHLFTGNPSYSPTEQFNNNTDLLSFNNEKVKIRRENKKKVWKEMSIRSFNFTVLNDGHIQQTVEQEEQNCLLTVLRCPSLLRCNRLPRSVESLKSP